MVCFRSIGAVALLFAGCRHAPSVPAVGRSAIQFVEAPAATPPPPAMGGVPGPRVPVDVLVPADAVLPLTLPVYPKAALAAKAGVATVGVKITVDANGGVSDVGSSLVAFSTPGPYAAAFREAVETAVAQWKFVPAEIRHLVPMKGGEKEFWAVTRTDKTEWTCDVVFTFNADGGVVSDAPAPGRR